MDNLFLQQVLNKADDRNPRDLANDIICTHLQEFITNQLNQMRSNHFLTDMILVCENQEFHVHSSVMVASSGFFQELVNKTGNTTTIQLPNVKASAITSLLTYIYVGKLEPLHTVNDLRSILAAAKWLQVNDFMFHVSAVIPQLLTYDNYLQVWVVADEFENRAVAIEVEIFVAANYVHLSSNPLFLEITPERMQCLCKNPDYRKIPTHVVLKSIINWVDHDKNVRRNFISSLLIYVHENFIDDVRQSSPLIKQKVNNTMPSVTTSPPRTTLSPPQRDTALEVHKTSTEPKAKPKRSPVNTKAAKESPKTKPKIRSSPDLHTNPETSPVKTHVQPKTPNVKTGKTNRSPIRIRSPMSNEETKIRKSQSISKERLNKSPKITEQVSLAPVLNVQFSVEDTAIIQDLSSSSLFINSSVTIHDESTRSSADNTFVQNEILPRLASSDATTTNATSISSQVLQSSDSLTFSLNYDTLDNLNSELGLVKYCQSSNSSTSYTQQKERVPRLLLTAASSDNCHLRRFASRCKISVNHAKCEDLPTRPELKFSDSNSAHSSVESTPESLSWPCVCPMLQKSDISIIEAVTALSERSSLSPQETEAIMIFNQALSDKLNCIPERETNCLQSMITVPIPVYHPMFYLNRNALEKSAFKPIAKNNRRAKTAREEGVTRDNENNTKTSRSEVKPVKKHQRGIRRTVPEVKSLATAKDNASVYSFASSRDTLSGLCHFNQQLNLRYFSRNFDGSPLTEPVVVILGYQKHGTLLMLNFNLDSHAWRRTEEIETVMKKSNLELLRNGVSIVHKNEVYIIGGEDKHSIPKPQVLIVKMQEQFEPILSSPLLIPRSGSGGTVFQDCIYVVGGITVGGKILNQAERYSFDDKEWKEIEPMPVHGWAMSLAELGKKLISVGGRKSGEFAIGCYSYDPEANQWTYLVGMPKEFESPYALVTLYGNQVLAFRRSNLNQQGSVAWLDPIHFTWHNLEVSGTPAKRILAAVRHRHKVWILDQSSRLFVYDPSTHTWENAFTFHRSISLPIYAFIVYRALPTQSENCLQE